MKLQIKKTDFFIQLLFLIFLSYISLYYYYSENSTGISYTILILFLFIIIKELRGGLSHNITFISFLICFFTFLLTRIFIPLFIDTSELIATIGGGTRFNEKIQTFINLSLYISLLCTYIGYEITNRKQSKEDNRFSIPFYKRKSITKVRRVSKKLALFFSLFELLYIFDQIRYVMVHGYMDYYLSYTPSIPYIIIFFASFFETFFIFYMATMPSKRECIPVIIVYLFVNFTSMGMGQRGGAILAVMFIISYFFIRNKVNPGKKPWITKRWIWIIIVSIPLVVSLLFLMAYSRTDKDTDKFENQNLVLSFFYQQGVTVNVIGFANYYENKLPEGKFYSIGKIIDFANHNIISQILFGTSSVKPQTVEHALQDHTLHPTLTYFESPDLYFSGGGYGGCYIADLWVDWGFWGIIIGNLIYGICLAKIRQWCSASFWKASIGLLMYTCILFAPRSNFIDFIYVFIPFTALICFAMIYLVKNGRISTRPSTYNTSRNIIGPQRS